MVLIKPVVRAPEAKFDLVSVALIYLPRVRASLVAFFWHDRENDSVPISFWTLRATDFTRGSFN